MEIIRLPEDLRNLVESGPVITDATHLVLELVYNALDARATAVAIRINLSKFYVQVVDNGFGMCKEDLELIGEKHVSSKCNRAEQLNSLLHTFGYRGCALSAIARTCGRLEIQTRPLSGSSTFKKVIVRGSQGPVEVCEKRRPAPGTTVTVYDFMINLPVRRQRIKDVFDEDDILQYLESLAVIFNTVSFSLRNDNNGKVLLQTNKQETEEMTLAQLFGLNVNRIMVPFCYSQENIEVSGYLCMKLHSDCLIQLVYVNNRIVHGTKIHKLVIDLMKKYGKFWEKDLNSPSVVDLNGYAFIVKVEIPYLNFSLEQHGRKTILHLQNAEEVLRCVHRAVKTCLREGLSPSIQTDRTQSQIDTAEAENREFGVSQVKNAVCGKMAKRQLAESTPRDQPFHETDEACTNYAEKVQEENVKRCLESRAENRPDGELRPVESHANNRLIYPDYFFKQYSSDEGTALAENAPIYEIDDFRQIPFHDFLARLQMKSKHDQMAKQLLGEFISIHSQPVVQYSNQPAPLVSIKELRQRKLAMRVKKKLGKVRMENGSNSIKNVSRQVYSREKNLPGNGKQIHTWPQMSYDEFISWVKLKSRHDKTLDRIVNEFHKIKLKGKTQPSIDSHSSAVNRPFATGVWTVQEEKTSNRLYGTGKMVTPDCSAPTKRKRPASAAIPKQPCTKKQREKERVDLENSTLLTWCSHYQNHGKENRSENLPPEKIPHERPAIDLKCNDVFTYDSDASEESIDLPSNGRDEVARLIKIKQKSTAQRSDKIVKEIGVQVSLIVQNASIQVDSPRRADRYTQTDSEPAINLAEIGIQTEFDIVRNAPSPKSRNTGPSSDLPCGQQMPNEKSSESIPIVLEMNETGDMQLTDTVPVDPQWEERADAAGKKYWVHSLSGCTSFNPPASSTRKSFAINYRADVGIPSAVAELVEDDFLAQLKAAIADSSEEYLAHIKWNNDGKIEPFREAFMTESTQGAAGMFQEAAIPTGKVSKVDANVHKLLSKYNFTKEDLEAAEVVGQLDNKFIVTMLKCSTDPEPGYPIICLFDQHAVDERIQLERLMKRYRIGTKWEIESLPKALVLPLPAKTVSFVQKSLEHYDYYAAHGLVIAPKGPEEISIGAVPACFIRKVERESADLRMPTMKNLVSDLLDELKDTFVETRGAGITVPKTIFKVIASEACRSAIKFNKPLERWKMDEMIRNLIQCQNPFHCAHGRPSMVPSLELADVVTPPLFQETKLNFKKFRKSRTYHGQINKFWY